METILVITFIFLIISRITHCISADFWHIILFTALLYKFLESKWDDELNTVVGLIIALICILFIRFILIKIHVWNFLITPLWGG